jgi:hypothetical protein
MKIWTKENDSPFREVENKTKTNQITEEEPKLFKYLALFVPADVSRAGGNWVVVYLTEWSKFILWILKSK